MSFDWRTLKIRATSDKNTECSVPKLAAGNATIVTKTKAIFF